MNSIRSFLLLSMSLLFAAVPAAQAQDSSAVVINAGVGGNNTRDLLARIGRDCLRHHPDLTVLMIGTNDMNSVKYIPLGTYRHNLERIIDTLREAGSAILLLNVLPMYPPYLFTRHPAAFYAPEGPEGRLAAMNAAIGEIASDKKISLLDIHHVFAAIGAVGTGKNSYIRNTANSGMTDGIHPTPDGYRAVAIAVYQYILDHDLPRHRVVCFGDSITKGDGSIDHNSYPAYLKKLLLMP